MKFRCKKCRTQYTIADEKVRGKVIKVRCKRCRSLIVIRGSDARPRPGASPAAGGKRDTGMERELDDAFDHMVDRRAGGPGDGAPAGAGPAGKDEWYYGLDGAELGPYSLAQMKEMAAKGQLDDQHFVWREGMKDWLPVEDVPELFRVVSPSGRMPPPPPPPRAPKRKTVPPDGRAGHEQKAAEDERRRAEEARKKAEAARSAEEAKKRAEAERKRTEEERSKKAGRKAPADTGTHAPPGESSGEFDEKTPAAFMPPEQLRKKTDPPARVSFRGGVRKDEHGRMDLIERVYEKRERVRADRTADRIAEHFFVPEDADIPGEDAPLPAPPVGDVDALARQLHEESIQEEHQQLQHDPIAVLVKRDQPGQSQQSKVTKMVVAQAGMGAAGKSRRLLITLLSVAGILGLVGAGGYLAYSQGWFAGTGFGRLADSVESAGLAPADMTLPDNFDDLSPAERRRLREALWERRKEQRERNSRTPARRAYPNAPEGPRYTKRGMELKRFYEQQSETKDEVLPRGPDGALISLAPAGIDMPSSTIDGAPLPDPGAKVEIIPQAPAAGPQRLTDLQIHQVIQKNFRQVHSCHQRQLKRDSRVAGKMYVVARVKPDGKVARVRIKTAKFHGTFVEGCLTRKIARWQFPSFRGEAYDVTFPLLLTTRGGP